MNKRIIFIFISCFSFLKTNLIYSQASLHSGSLEILTCVVSFLEIKDRLSSRRVCRDFNLCQDFCFSGGDKLSCSEALELKFLRMPSVRNHREGLIPAVKIKINLPRCLSDTVSWPATFSALTCLPSLKFLELNLQRSIFNEELGACLAKTFKQMEALEDVTINLYRTKISVTILKEVLLALSSKENLSKLSLDLGCNNLKNSGIFSIIEGLKSFKTLTFLNLGLYKNNLGDRGAEALVLYLEESCSLLEMVLNLSGNHLKAELLPQSTFHKKVKDVKDKTRKDYF
ncbi:MAG: hypothetical protein CMP11_07035 [Zetaproteobacteria bacterium]|nr:hypothetical protein [Pseudobdellovibrionaceae bacterium]